MYENMYVDARTCVHSYTPFLVMSYIICNSHHQDITNNGFVAGTVKIESLKGIIPQTHKIPVKNDLIEEEPIVSQEEQEELRISTLTFECFLTLKTRYIYMYIYIFIYIYISYVYIYHMFIFVCIYI
jgi:hypothetical protein